ncbi:hypothetical protein M427DRAFT_69435 [Gonapodya prolifera JEL478]|uniref:Meiosis-specific nuclear structural protein 1 n=1 Tax=Gonapodya prolifera (strain JEL478) TaxID=1344416 RepID=A0A139AGW7_GONPJ|nr:hypothetical protein M427DRAFT_69435 [Gonapodya prolifera JEL478]|eukprot:KXS16072.1 hypothetical protein M427DRAFT_69435 [Gonapodya prolifera JEL478]
MAQSRLILERRQQESRRKEYERTELASQLRQHSLMREANSQEDRIDMLRKMREERERREYEQRRTEIQEFERHKQERIAQQLHAEAVAKEEERHRLEALRKEKTLQSIRETSLELRELEQKLNYAYMNKERSLQVKEKQLAEQLLKAEEAKLSEDRKRNAQREAEEEYERARAHMEKQVSYKHELQRQLEDRVDRKKAEYEQFLKDKAVIDDLVRKIQEEDESERRAELDKQAETQRDLQEHLNQREAWKRDELRRQAEENARIAEHAAVIAKREAEALAAKKGKAEEQNALYEKVARTIEGRERVRAELEELRIEVHRAEQDERERQKEQEMLQKRIRARLEMLDSYRKMLEVKREREMKERAEEQKVLEALLKKYKEDEALEHLTARARRQRMIDYKKEIDRIIADRRAAVERERAQQAEFDRATRDLEAYRRGVIEMERQRLLREHAAGLVGFLPKGVLRDDKDLEAFDQEFRQRFQHQHQQ